MDLNEQLAEKFSFNFAESKTISVKAGMIQVVREELTEAFGSCGLHLHYYYY